MRIKDFFENLQYSIFTNILILYLYMQLLFLIIFFIIGRNTTYPSLNSSVTTNFIDFYVLFLSFLISLFMILGCSFLTCIEYLLMKRLKIKFIQFDNCPIFLKKLHDKLFNFGLIILFLYLLFILIISIHIYFQT